MRTERFALGLTVMMFGAFHFSAWSQTAVQHATKPPVKTFSEAAVKDSESVDVCYNYGCVAEGNVVFSGKQLTELRGMLRTAGNAERERVMLAQAIGRMYAWAAEQTPVGNDKAGNFADGGMIGQMDCIDHSTTTTRFLQLLDRRGWLRFHRVDDVVRRSNFLFLQHFSAAIEDLGDGVSVIRTDDEARTWAVDSWYVDNGKPAWIAPLGVWEVDHGPN